VFHNKPIIGIAGGIGSGKSFVSRLFAELGSKVIGSDDLITLAYTRPEVREALQRWWGDAVLKSDGSVDRRAIAARIFNDPIERQRLEQLLHPLANQMRQELMEAAANDSQVLAFIWDTPLLFETGLNAECDAVVFVDAPLALRQARVLESRGWSPEELHRREISQMPLDRKREIADYVIVNTADAGSARSQVRDVLSQILGRSVQWPT
jgi:dephospho-CoA kinase